MVSNPLGILHIGFKLSQDLGYWILVFESLWILDIESQPTTPIFRAVTLTPIRSLGSLAFPSGSCIRGFGRDTKSVQHDLTSFVDEFSLPQIIIAYIRNELWHFGTWPLCNLKIAWSTEIVFTCGFLS